MATAVIALPTLEDLRKHVLETLCRHDQLDPDLAEAWRQRAIARYEQGDTQGAVRDLEETLKREPRHFGAFETLSRIAENRKDWKSAYSAWQKVLEIDPKTPGGEQRLKDLRRRAMGEQT